MAVDSASEIQYRQGELQAMLLRCSESCGSVCLCAEGAFKKPFKL